MLITLVVFVLFAKDSPNQPAPRSLADYAAVMRMRDTWWFCLFYSITFGGFVGLASFLNIAFALVGGFGGAAALACANREWQGIFIGHRGIALDRG